MNDTAPTTTSDHDPTGTDAIGRSLDALAELQRYNHWIFNLMAHHVRGRVLEIGGGTGNLTSLIAQHADHVVSLEPVERFAEAAQARFKDNPNVEVFPLFLQDYDIPADPQLRFDTAMSFNVIEHIEDDVAAHAQIKSMLKPGGKVITFVPAGPRAYGKLDESLGHYRRYTLKSLRNTMEQAGLRWVEGRFHNRVGWFGWWLNSRVLKKTDVPAGQAATFDKLLPIFSLVDKVAPLPFGQSVIGVGEA